MRFFLAAGLAAALLLSGGCTAEQIQRAEAMSQQADARLAAADAALARANDALAQAEAVAARTPEAAPIIAQAKAALDLAVSAKDVAKLAADGAHQAVDSAKAVQAAGGSALDVIGAALIAFLPTAGVAFAFIRKAISAGQALSQTVAGIEEAKKTMPPDTIANLHGALAEAQDDHVKAAVSLIKASL